MRSEEAIDIEAIEKAQQSPEPRGINGLVSTDHLPEFMLFNAGSISEAIFLLLTHKEKASIVAGGTSLLLEMKRRSQPLQPRVLINIIKSMNPSLEYLTEDGAGLKIGSTARLNRIENYEPVKKRYELLGRAARASGFLQHRTMATIGVDLCRRVTCWYYQTSGNFYHCLRKKGEQCFARDGDNRYHAIFGDTDCCAVFSSDVAPALVALNATIKATGPKGVRLIPIDEFFTPSGTILQQPEILTEIQIPKPTPFTKSSFIKLGRRNEFDQALACVAVSATVRDGICMQARIAFGSVSTIPWRDKRLEKAIEGEAINKKTTDKAAEIITHSATPLKMNGYKVDLVRVLITCSLNQISQ